MDYKNNRLPILILVCAGADANTNTWLNNILEIAVGYDDAQLTAILFKHNVNPNKRTAIGKYPIFYIKTTEIARIFIDNKVNIHRLDGLSQRNVLWYTVKDNYPSELMELYLNCNVDATILEGKDCLLHKLAEPNHIFEININNFFKKARLLLNTIPTMINTRDQYERTPIDLAQETIKFPSHIPKNNIVFKNLIALYRKHGGKTAKEIQEASMILLLHNDEHLGDLSMLPHDVRKYIVQYIDALNK